MIESATRIAMVGQRSDLAPYLDDHVQLGERNNDKKEDQDDHEHGPHRLRERPPLPGPRSTLGPWKRRRYARRSRRRSPT